MKSNERAAGIFYKMKPMSKHEGQDHKLCEQFEKDCHDFKENMDQLVFYNEGKIRHFSKPLCDKHTLEI